MEPKLIYGGNYCDARGEIAFVNDFKFSDITRFYTISNSESNPFRAWQGHKLDSKKFYCISGSFKIFYVKIDNWENPSPNLAIESCVLLASDSKIIEIPPGYANGILALEPNSKLLSFATLPLEKTKEDDVRFDINFWKIENE